MYYYLNKTNLYKNSQAVKSVQLQKSQNEKDVKSKVAAKKWLW